MLEEKNLSCKIMVQENVPEEFHIEKKIYMEILFNLIQNAVKFNRIGGSILITIRYEKYTEQLWTSIEDNGQGIKDKLKRNLFIAFRSKSSKMSNKTGIGIGLSISKCLVTALNGEIKISSKEGKGTIVNFCIDLVLTKHQKLSQSSRPTLSRFAQSVQSVPAKAARGEDGGPRKGREVVRQRSRDRRSGGNAASESQIQEEVKEAPAPGDCGRGQAELRGGQPAEAEEGGRLLHSQAHSEDGAAAPALLNAAAEGQQDSGNDAVPPVAISRESRLLARPSASGSSDRVGGGPLRGSIFEPKPPSHAGQSRGDPRSGQQSPAERPDEQLALLPSESAAAGPIGKAAGPGELSEEKCKCSAAALVVDDDEFSILPLSVLLLQNHNIVSAKASDGAEAVELIRADRSKKCCDTRIQLVLMNLAMPVLDGFAASE